MFGGGGYQYYGGGRGNLNIKMLYKILFSISHARYIFLIYAKSAYFYHVISVPHAFLVKLRKDEIKIKFIIFLFNSSNMLKKFI